jgi:parallel beta-helix repeat protein
LISKSIHILAVTLAFCFALSSFVIGLQSSSTIANFGTISLIRTRSYICGNYNSTHYYALNNVTGAYELISTDPVQTISYALSKLTIGRTWQETVALEGNFSIARTITLSVGSVLLDCRQATLTLTANTALISVTGGNNYTFLGGHFVGPNTASTNNMAFRFVSCSNCLIDGTDISGFPGNNGGIIEIGYGTSGMTVQNCNLHDNGVTMGINLLNAGYNKIINCIIANPSQGIFVADTCGYNQILGCEFYGWHQGNFGHAIYLDGGGASVGHNIVSGCKFHDPLGYAGVVIKCQNNSIHDNTFWNFPSGASPFSIYSQYSPCTANDNDCYNNTMTDCVWAVAIGNANDLSPTLGNKFHDNKFIRCSICFFLGGGDPVLYPCNTWVYYNTFTNCTEIFPLSPSSPSNIVNTVIAYNTFDANVPSADVTALKSYTNTMITGNSPWLADYNPVYDTNSPYYIPPK